MSPARRLRRRPRAARPARRVRVVALGALALLGGLLLAACGDSAPPGAVHVVTVDGDIGPVTANFIDRAIDRAEDRQAAVLVLQLDTPGGLLSSKDKIVKRIQAADVPVVVYVTPAGGRAASAGTFLTIAAHVAAMAPGTEIGAAAVVSAGGGDVEGTLGTKITNDQAASIRALATLRGRNAAWAEQAVREAVSATADEALALGVIDVVASSLDDLLIQIDGRRVPLRPDGPTITLHTADAPRVQTTMTLFERVLDVIATPDIAFLLLSLGGLAIFIEILTPGLMGPGIFGVIMLVLAFFSLDTLDTNPAGVALVVLAFVLIIAEVFVAGFGALGIGGILALILGGLFLISDSPDTEQVSLWLVLGSAAVLGSLVLSVWWMLLRSRRSPHRRPSATEALIGTEAVVRSALDPRGTVLAADGLWSARSGGGALPAGTRVRVLGVEGLTLLVEPLDSAPAGPPPGAANATPPRSNA